VLYLQQISRTSGRVEDRWKRLGDAKTTDYLVERRSVPWSVL
jgi:hypothetical protein